MKQSEATGRFSDARALMISAKPLAGNLNPSESAWLLNRPAGDVVLENKLFYRNFGLEIDSQAAPDHLLTQLEFLAWLDHCLAAGNPDAASLERARAEFLERHLAHWIRPPANLARNADGDCYADLLDALSLEIESAG